MGQYHKCGIGGRGVYSYPMGVTSGAGTAYPYRASEFTPVFSGVRVTRSLVLCVCLSDHKLAGLEYRLTYGTGVQTDIWD
jgi:hypothetical protein